MPANYGPWLAKAVERYDLGPRGFAIVAAVHSVESDFGRSTLAGVRSGTNFAGAMGPGQFLAGTWAAFGVDADGDGTKDPYSVPDSIFSTANYLSASGAPADWEAALFAYNHADAYVQKVLEASEVFEGEGEVVCEPEIGGEGVEGVLRAARWIESQRIHYCWGGGHGAKPGALGRGILLERGGRQGLRRLRRRARLLRRSSLAPGPLGIQRSRAARLRRLRRPRRSTRADLGSRSRSGQTRHMSS